MKTWKIVAVAVIVVGVLVGVVSCEVSLWRECRTDHSWFYCVRVLGSK